MQLPLHSFHKWLYKSKYLMFIVINKITNYYQYNWYHQKYRKSSTCIWFSEKQMKILVKVILGNLIIGLTRFSWKLLKLKTFKDFVDSKEAVLWRLCLQKRMKLMYTFINIPKHIKTKPKTICIEKRRAIQARRHTFQHHLIRHILIF